MSANGGSAAKVVGVKATSKPQTWSKGCAVLVGENLGSVLAVDEKVFKKGHSKVGARFMASRGTDVQQFIGLALDFPIFYEQKKTRKFGIRSRGNVFSCSARGLTAVLTDAYSRLSPGKHEAG
ncbi:hypothetical protein IMZ48_41740 [Candidatus Bathyarchaeota archaeon]|nr:hypothetical protein [Candidatus Bathyarchaeota archaeon]